MKIIPDEIALFKNGLTSLSIDYGEVEIISNKITEMKNLESIEIDFIPLKSIPFDLSDLKKLKKLSIKNTKFAIQNKRKFIVPENCEVIIE